VHEESPVTDVALLSVRDLEVKFVTRRATVHAVSGISFDLEAGETLGIVGESGCGKSVSSLAMLGILPRPAGRVTGGEVRFEDRDLLQLRDSDLRRIRGRDIAMIFQDPMTSLNPVLTVGRQLTESSRKHLGMDKSQAEEAAISLLERVGIPSAKERLRDYPHQFSGGMRQRVMIAMAISCSPKILIADEPTTALDVTIQAQILEVIKQLVAEENMALILITHDLGVVAGVCERTNVMYAGRFVETASTKELFARPRHPYTLGLLKSVPRLDAARKEKLHPIGGSPRDLTKTFEGCAFAPRCSYATEESRERTPILQEADESSHFVACWNPVPDSDLPRTETIPVEVPKRAAG
jgi:oligopeptide transport system ATP-binding protein